MNKERGESVSTAFYRDSHFPEEATKRSMKVVRKRILTGEKKVAIFKAEESGQNMCWEYGGDRS